jgi:hypothetical protein
LAKPRTKQDDPEQSRRFIEMAGELGAKGSRGSLDRAVKKLAAHARLQPKSKVAKKGR